MDGPVLNYLERINFFLKWQLYRKMAGMFGKEDSIVSPSTAGNVNFVYKYAQNAYNREEMSFP
jgi:hypothetical protein